MSKQVNRLMLDWLEKRRQLYDAHDMEAPAGVVARLERETVAAFAAWRDAVRIFDQAA